MSLLRQHPNASRTWVNDWADQLTEYGGRTITDATVSSPTPGVTATKLSTTATTVLLHLSTDGSIPERAYAQIDVGITMDNGDTDEQDYLIQITKNA